MSEYKWELIQPSDDLWQDSIRCQALYECPKDVAGKRLGPLVPYAGKYGSGKNFVGEVYFNFGWVEPHVRVVEAFAVNIAKQIAQNPAFAAASTIVGIPEGGRTLAQEVARHSGKRFVYPLKEPKGEQKTGGKAEFNFVFTRNDLHPGEAVIVVDDVHNNFQNTTDTIETIAETGATVVGFCSALNRSETVEGFFCPKTGAFASDNFPLISAIRRPLKEFIQEHPDVAQDIGKGNIEWKVKQNWARLRASMEAHRK